MCINRRTNTLRITFPLLGIARNGGIRVISELANGLVRKGYQVSIVTPYLDTFPFILDDKVKLIGRKNIIKSNSVFSRIKGFYFVLSKSKNESDIIVSNYYLTFYIGQILKIFFRKKHVYFIQDFEAEFFSKKKKLLDTFKITLAKISYHLKPDLRITISSFIKDKIGAKDIKIISDGVDLNVFKPNATEKKEIHKKTICSIARQEYRKGFTDFIDAVNLLYNKRNDFRILLFTNQKDFLFNASFPYEIIYPKSDSEIVTCLHSSDIFVSASHFEGFGLPALEAMACGVGVISTDCGGIKEYGIDYYNCIITPIADKKSLSNSIEILLDDNQLLSTLIENGVKTVQNFTWEIMCDNFEKELIKLQK